MRQCERLLKAAKDAIDAVAGDTSVSHHSTRDMLQELVEHIEPQLDALNQEIADEDGEDEEIEE